MSPRHLLSASFSRLLAGLAALLLGLSSLAAAQASHHNVGGAAARSDEVSRREVRKRMKEMARPGIEHERLSPLVGRFKFRAYFRLLLDDTPESAHGIAETSWMIGERFIEQRIRGRRATRSFDGLLILGFDRYAERYVGFWLAESDSGMASISGVLDEDGRTIRLEVESNDARFEERLRRKGALVIESEDRFTLRFEEQDLTTGEWVEMASIEFERDR